ncbi:MAG: bifunctional oligoribonuclease/PAP phosphatase NrnA [bacterium]
MNENIVKLAPVIFDSIEESKSILLHFHPHPDPDSIGSALAMKLVLEKMGKKVTVIKGDSSIEPAFKNFPGMKDVVLKNIFEVELSEFDLFIILDSSNLQMVSKVSQIVFPKSLKTIVIDHHASNTKFGDINLVVSEAPANTQIVFQLLKALNIEIDHDIAMNLMAGLWSDTGGFQYSQVKKEAFEAAAELSGIAPDYTRLLFEINNTNTKESLYILGIALNNIELYCGGRLAITKVTRGDLEAKRILPQSVSLSSHMIIPLMRSVVGWDVALSITEEDNGKFKLSFRTRNSSVFDLSKIAGALGGGGHKEAAGAYMGGSIDEIKAKVVALVEKLIV